MAPNRQTEELLGKRVSRRKTLSEDTRLPSGKVAGVRKSQNTVSFARWFRGPRAGAWCGGAVLYYRRMHIRTVFFVFALLVNGFLPLRVVEARGTLVKGSLPAVYYVASDGNRYAFPNERIYTSWYADFSGVTTIEDTELASYPLGGNVMYRPGTRLIKLTNDPKVYAVEPGGVLRWVTSESVAQSLWGTSWASRVDDLSDSLFGSYTHGEDLETARYPEGSLLVDASSGTYFVMEYGELREFTSTALGANGYQTKDAVSVNASTFEQGVDISGEETELSDVASVGLGKDMEEDVVAVGTDPSGVIIQGGEAQVLGRVTLSFRTTTTMQRVSVLLEAEDDADEDADAGGLVRGDDEEQIEPNLDNVRLVDLDGNEPFGAASVAQSTTGDDAQALIMTGSVTFKAGSHTFLLVADVDEDAPVGQTYRATFYVTGSQFVVGPEESEYVTPERLAFSSVDVAAGGISVAVSDAAEDVVVVGGEQDGVTVNQFTFTNETSGTATVSSVTFTGYVDEGEGNDDFGAGSDMDAGTATFVKQVVTSLSLVSATSGAALGTCGTIGSDGTVSCTGMNWGLSAGESEDVQLVVFISGSAPYDEGADRVAFDIVEEEDVIASLSVSVTTPNGGEAPATVLTVADHGTLTIEGSGAPDTILAMSTTDHLVYTMTFTASDIEGVEVDGFSLRLLSPDGLRSLSDGRLRYTSAGVETTVEGQKSASGLLFSNASVVVPAGSSVSVDVYADVASSGSGASSGDELGFGVETTVFTGHGVLSGVTFGAGDIGEAITMDADDGSSATVRKNLPAITSLVSSVDTAPATARAAETLRFTLASTGEGTVQLDTLTFRVDPSDIGTTGDDNDLLEYWADVNGDSRDDDDIVDLIDVAADDVLAEASNDDVDFSIYDSSAAARDTSPAGITTASGDYGLITVTFASPLSISSTGRTLSLELDLSGLAGDEGTVTVTLLGSSDFVWGDGSYALGSSSLTGTGVSGIPLSSSTITIE